MALLLIITMGGVALYVVATWVILVLWLAFIAMWAAPSDEISRQYHSGLEFFLGALAQNAVEISAATGVGVVVSVVALLALRRTTLRTWNPALQALPGAVIGLLAVAAVLYLFLNAGTTRG